MRPTIAVIAVAPINVAFSGMVMYGLSFLTGRLPDLAPPERTSRAFRGLKGSVALVALFPGSAVVARGLAPNEESTSASWPFAPLLRLTPSGRMVRRAG